MIDSRAKPFLGMFSQAGSRYAIPAAYLYALSKGESNWKPRQVASVRDREPTATDIRKHAVGLFQLTKGAVEHYNADNGTSYTKNDMLDPSRNTDVAAWYLANVVHHVLPIDWDDERQVALFTQAWNSGPYGAARLIGDGLKSNGVTVDTVKGKAKLVVAAGKPFAGLQAKSYIHFADRDTSWAKRIARRYMDTRGDSFQRPRVSSNGLSLVLFGIGALIALHK